MQIFPTSYTLASKLRFIVEQVSVRSSAVKGFGAFLSRSDISVSRRTLKDTIARLSSNEAMSSFTAESLLSLLIVVLHRLPSTNIVVVSTALHFHSTHYQIATTFSFLCFDFAHFCQQKFCQFELIFLDSTLLAYIKSRLFQFVDFVCVRFWF